MDMKINDKVLALIIAALTGSLYASSWYAAPQAKVDPDDPNYCIDANHAGTLADAVALANAGNVNDEEVVLVNGIYEADWAPTGLEFILPGVTIRSESGDREKCIIDGGGDFGGRRAFWFHGNNAAYCNAISNITFRNFHLDHSRDATLWRKGAVLYFERLSPALIVNCDFLDSTCGTLGENVAGAHMDYDSRYKDNSSGGAITAYGYVHASGCNFRRVKSSGTGGAVCMHGNNNWFDNCVFDKCMVSNTAGDVAFSAGILASPGASRNNSVAASNCVFRDNFVYSGREVRGGAVLNAITYRCRFERNVAITGKGGQGQTIYCYTVTDDLTQFYTHIEDVIDNAGRVTLDSDHPELNGGTYVRCRIYNNSNNIRFSNGVRFYNCLIQDSLYSSYGGNFWNCTFANSRNGGGWGASWFGGAAVVNCAMIECTCGSGYLIGWNNGPYHYYDAYDAAVKAGTPNPAIGTVINITNSVYAGTPYDGADRGGVGGWSNPGLNNTQYDPNNPDTYYAYVNPASTTDPWRPARDSYLVDRGVFIDEMADRHSYHAYDILGNPRCAGGAPDIGCYEYYVKPGISVMLR